MIKPQKKKVVALASSCLPLSLLALFSIPSVYQTLIALCLFDSNSQPTTAHYIRPSGTHSIMARAKRSAPQLAVVQAPKQEGRSRGRYVRLMVVTTPPPSISTKQSKVPTDRNEGTVLQDDKGKTSYRTSEIKADNTGGVLDDSKSDGESSEEKALAGGDEQDQQGKKKKRSVAKAKRWTRIKTRGPSKVKPPNRESNQSSTLTLRTDGRRHDI